MPSIINASSSGSGGIVQTADASGVLQLQTNGSVALTVSTTRNITLTSTGATGLVLDTDSSSTGNSSRLFFMNATTGVSLRSSSASTDGQLIFSTGATPDNSSGVARTYFNKFGIGLAAIPSSGTGLSFPATQDPSSDVNTLDDYEEGTFTATVNSNNGSFNVPGWYVKVGAMVSVGISISYNGTAGTSNLNSITGLPFTNSSSLSIPAPCGLYYVMTTSTGDNNTCVPGFILGGTSNVITLYTSQVGSSEGRPRFINSNSYFQVCATYPAS